MFWLYTYLTIHCLFGYVMVLVAAYPEVENGDPRTVTMDKIAVIITLGLPLTIMGNVHEIYKTFIRRS